MDVRSLGYRTDLALLRLGGTIVEDRGDHLLVRSPHNPTYWWGNFLLLAAAPGDVEEARSWIDTFRLDLPEARHRTFGVDGTDGTATDLAPFAELGFDTEWSSVMTATSVHEPPRPHREATYRPLTSEDDWDQQLSLSLAGEDPVDYSLDFCRGRVRADRALVAAGYGAWWGAFVGERLCASMGLFTASEGLARFQTVKTHPDARGRGLAGTLVHRVSRYGFDELGARTLVMVADPDYLAIRIYRSVGFAESERQLQAELKPR